MNDEEGMTEAEYAEREPDPDAVGLRAQDPGDDEHAMTEDEHAVEHADDPPERDDPEGGEHDHPETTPDEGGAEWP